MFPFRTQNQQRKLLTLIDKNRQSWRRNCWPAFGAILAIAVSMVTLDRCSSTFAIEAQMPGDIRAFFQCMSFFGHGTGFLIAVSLIWALDRKNKSAIPFIFGAVFLSGAISAAIKVIIHRPRPFVDQTTVADSITLNEALFHNFLQSFPSGHTATAFALAMALSLLYRQGKPLFLSFAVLVGLQRILSQNHFPSDVIAGAVVGIVSAQAVLSIMLRRSLATPTTAHTSAEAPENIAAPQIAAPSNSGRQPSVSGITPA